MSLCDVTAEYFPGQPVLSGLNLTAQAGQITVILGPNGSGKSTALRVMAGLLSPAAGRVTLELAGKVTDLTPVPAYRHPDHRIAYLPQGHSIFPAMTVHDNLVMGAWPLRRDRKAVAAATARVYQRYPQLREKRGAPAGTLSGGQQRILEVARLLVPDPAVVLVDEPSAGVAPAVAASMYDELSRMRAEGRTVILVDQDVRPALAIADVVYTLRSGRNDRRGLPAEFSADVSAVVREWLTLPHGPDQPHESGEASS